MCRAVKGMGVALLTLVWIALSAWGVLANTPGHPRYSWKVLLSGYFPEYVYEQGRLDTRLPFEELRKRSRINAVAEAADAAPTSRTGSGRACRTHGGELRSRAYHALHLGRTTVLSS